MKFLPNEKLRFRSKLSDREILNRVSGIIDPKGVALLYESEKPYKGEIIDNKFTMNRKINYQNAFLPVINGFLKKDVNGTIIDIKMKMPLYTLIFSTFFYLLIGTVFLTTIYLSLVESQFRFGIIIQAGMLAFNYVLSMIGFKHESKKSKIFLAKLFESDSY